MEKQYDLSILGGGPAGLTAALYAVRSGLKTAIITKDIGGTANKIFLLENWPGFNGTGAKLIKQIYEQLKDYDVDIIMAETKSIKKNKKSFIIELEKTKVNAKTVIIATGTKRKELNIPNEKEFIGKGVSYCVTCDSHFFKKKNVAVIGGSDCAATSALILSDITKKTYILYRGKELRCEDIISNRLKKKGNVEILYESIPIEIKGNKKVSALKFKQNNKKSEIKVDGIFIEIGSAPLTEFAKNLKLKLDKENYIIADKNMKTSIPGIFAAGDVTSFPLQQAIVAAGQGAIAAKSAYDFLKISF